MTLVKIDAVTLAVWPNLNEEYWVGASDKDAEGSWKWTDGPLVSLKTGSGGLWESGEPNDAGWSGASENCAFISTALKMNDVPCSIIRKYVCQGGGAR